MKVALTVFFCEEDLYTRAYNGCLLKLLAAFLFGNAFVGLVFWGLILI